MREIKDGGPAFPATWANDSDLNAVAPNGQVVPPFSSIPLPGMTLRDYFAAKAMQAALASVTPGPMTTHAEIAEAVAPIAYLIADAMLRTRGEA